MQTYFSPTGNPEVWEFPPAGYLTPEEWEAAHPAPEPPPPTEEELKEVLRQRILMELADLDRTYLTPRTLASAAMADEFALGRLEEHEAKAAPLRAELKTL
jgi:hypothetical protein